MKRIIATLGLAAGLITSTAHAQDIPTIRVGWTIPAEEAKYWMMRRPQEFPDLGKTYKIEWSQFQGTSVMSQALIAGALDCATQGVLPIAQGAAAGTLNVYIVAEHVGEKPGSFSVYWAVKEDSPIKTVADLKGKTVGISIIGGGTQGPFNLMLKRNGIDPEKDIKLVEVSFPLSEEAIRSGRVDSNRAETMKVVSETMKVPVEVLDTYLLKPNDFAREPGAAPNFAGIQAMLDVYADTGMINKKLDANQFKHPTIVAPIE